MKTVESMNLIEREWYIWRLKWWTFKMRLVGKLCRYVTKISDNLMDNYPEMK